MSYAAERDHFVSTMTRNGLDLPTIRVLLRAATTMQRIAELECSSADVNRDRVPCPATTGGPCLCDHRVRANAAEPHERIPRIRIEDYRAEQRAKGVLPAGWILLSQGDPRGYVLRVVPPSYTERNAGRDRDNLDSIAVPSRPTRLRF